MNGARTETGHPGMYFPQNISSVNNCATFPPLQLITHSACCFWGSAGQLKNRIAVWTSDPTRVSALVQTWSFKTPAGSFFKIYFYSIFRQSWFRSGTPSLWPPTPGNRRRSSPSTSWRPPATWKVSSTSCMTLATEAFLHRRYCDVHAHMNACLNSHPVLLPKLSQQGKKRLSRFNYSPLLRRNVTTLLRRCLRTLGRRLKAEENVNTFRL